MRQVVPQYTVSMNVSSSSNMHAALESLMLTQLQDRLAINSELPKRNCGCTWSMAAADTWMRLEDSSPELYAQTETFEKQQQRDFLTQLLARPSALYRQAAISGLSPAALRLECWKVGFPITNMRRSCAFWQLKAFDLTDPCSLQRLAEIQGVTRRTLATPKLEIALDVKDSIET